MAGIMFAMMTEVDGFRRNDSTDSNMSYNMALDIVDSYINNCHGMTTEETLNHVRRCIEDCLTHDFFSEAEREALRDGLFIVEYFENQ